ncbi:MAG TPA: hypothetical protein DGU37_04965, partial [Microbacterium sp.]|nr:hypothetical protein [Microbacterium sp.]
MRERIDQLGLTRTALLDRVREDRGPDDAPHFALSTTRDLTTMFSSLANGRAVSAAVSAQVTGWLAEAGGPGDRARTVAARPDGLSDGCFDSAGDFIA